MFILLDAIIQDPYSPGALSNLNALREFSCLLYTYVNRENCHLGAALEWIVEIEAAAARIMAGSTQEVRK